MESAKCKPNCQPVILSFTVELPYGQLLVQWKGLWQRYLWRDNLEPISRPKAEVAESQVKMMVMKKRQEYPQVCPAGLLRNGRVQVRPKVPAVGQIARKSTVL